MEISFSRDSLIDEEFFGNALKGFVCIDREKCKGKLLIVRYLIFFYEDI